MAYALNIVISFHLFNNVSLILTTEGNKREPLNINITHGMRNGLNVGKTGSKVIKLPQVILHNVLNFKIDFLCRIMYGVVLLAKPIKTSSLQVLQSIYPLLLIIHVLTLNCSLSWSCALLLTVSCLKWTAKIPRKKSLLLYLGPLHSRI